MNQKVNGTKLNVSDSRQRAATMSFYFILKISNLEKNHYDLQMIGKIIRTI